MDNVARLSFEPLYYAHRLRQVNRYGDVGIITLWSDFDAVRRHLSPVADELFDEATSRVAVIANLYGDGMYAMLCNLLHNPQVIHLIALGYDRGLPTCDEIESFLAHGLKDADLLGVPVKRIVGATRVFPAHRDFDAKRLRSTLSFSYLGRLNDELPSRLMAHLRQLPPPPATIDQRRVTVDMSMSIQDGYVARPSDVGAHQVVRAGPLACWKELVVRVVRFGRLAPIGNEQRLELTNVKAVITRPEAEAAEILAGYGFDREGFGRYEKAMMDPDPPEAGVSYTYGNRLRGYFPQGESGSDTLDTVIKDLRSRPDSRHAYIALWDTAADLPPLPSGEHPDSPCLTSVFFRRVDERLTVTATFRVHNLLRAWLENAYGLIAIQRHVCAQLGTQPGPLTVISHILGINPAATDYERALAIAERWTRDDDYDEHTHKYALRPDPHGNFVVSVDPDARQVVAEHWAGGILIKRYQGERADRIARDIAGDMAVSLPAHALWLGQMLADKEQQLRQLSDGE